MENSTQFDDIAISLDIDWAPDFVIDAVSRMLVANRVKATWFVTHSSEGVRRLSEHLDLFELGIHPNFMDGSSQGKSTREVMDYLKKIVPDAKSVRTHGMVYSAEISRIFAVEYGLENDSSIFLGQMPHIIPQDVFYGEKRMTRMPYFWADDGEMSIKKKPSFTSADGKFDVPGLKILCMHPIHIYLNSMNMTNYNKLKKEVDIKIASEKEVNSFINEDIGTASLLKELINKRINAERFYTIHEIGEKWRVLHNGS